MKKGILIFLLSSILTVIVYVYDPQAFILALFLLGVITLLIFSKPKDLLNDHPSEPDRNPKS